MKVQSFLNGRRLKQDFSFVPVKLLVEECTGSCVPLRDNENFSRGLMVIFTGSTEQVGENLKWDLPDPVSKRRNATLANTSLIWILL